MEEIEDSASIDGVILVVIYDDPAVHPQLTKRVTVYFGGQSVFGDTFVIGLPEPGGAFGLAAGCVLLRRLAQRRNQRRLPCG